MKHGTARCHQETSPLKRAAARWTLKEAEPRGLLARHHGSQFFQRRTECTVASDVCKCGPKTPVWGCGTCKQDGNWASKTVCRQRSKPVSTRVRNAAKQQHEKVAKQTQQTSIAKLEEQLDPPLIENAKSEGQVKNNGTCNLAARPEHEACELRSKHCWTSAPNTAQNLLTPRSCVKDSQLTTKRGKSRNRFKHRSPMRCVDWNRKGKQNPSSSNASLTYTKN